jgi:hypothetical protein
MIIGKAQAIKSLVPTAEFIIRGDDLEWLDKEQTKPTDAEIAAEITRLQAEYEAKEYARKRQVEYPTLGEQLDMLWHAIDSGTLDKDSHFYTALKAVKNKYPKSDE